MPVHAIRIVLSILIAAVSLTAGPIAAPAYAQYGGEGQYREGERERDREEREREEREREREERRRSEFRGDRRTRDTECTASWGACINDCNRVREGEHRYICVSNCNNFLFECKEGR
ncbi:MAG: hypothetical protein HQK82_04310 [Desulfovibrionaceae bacterium]|nr:hypothetical protein [Desulfovibrionaceae bacterium]